MAFETFTSLAGRDVVLPAREARRPMVPVPTNVARIWIGAALVGALGAAIILYAPPGINWLLWTTAASLVFVDARRRAKQDLSSTTTLCVALAVALAAGAAVTADPLFHVLIVLGASGLLALAVVLCAGTDARDLGAVRILTAPLVGWALSAAEVVRRTGELTERVRGQRVASLARGALFAVPVVVVFALLLSGADPTFALWRDNVGTAIQTLSFLPRVACFLALGALTLGASGVAARGAPAWRRAPAAAGEAPASAAGWATPSAADSSSFAPWKLGHTERLLVVGSVGGLFGLFLLLQVSYLFGNAPAVHGNGITFADYARRGFGELSVVATLCTIVLAWVFHGVRPRQQGKAVRWAGLAVVVELQLLTDSAMHRVWLYQDAYGFTAARVLALAYMVAVTLLLIVLGLELWAGLDARRLARSALVVAAGGVAVMSFWNYEAFVVRWNVQRYVHTGQVDWWYLGEGLSPNAAPELVRQRSNMPAPRAALLTLALRERFSPHGRRRTAPWYAWNLSRSRATAALARDTRSDADLRSVAGLAADASASDALWKASGHSSD